MARAWLGTELVLLPRGMTSDQAFWSVPSKSRPHVAHHGVWRWDMFVASVGSQGPCSVNLNPEGCFPVVWPLMLQ